MRRLVVVLMFSLWVGGSSAPNPEMTAPESTPIVVTRTAVADQLGFYLTAAAERRPADDAIAAMQRGLELVRKGEADAAVASFERAAELLPGIADWAHVLAASAAATAGDTATVRRLLDATDPLLAREWGWRARVWAARDAGDPERALRIAGEVASELTDAAARAELFLMVGRTGLERRDTAVARDGFRSAIREAPASVHAIDAARALSALSDLTPDDHLAIGSLYLRHRNIDRGLAGVDRYLASGRGTAEERARVRLEAARALFEGRQYVQAERRLISLATVTEAPDVAAEATLLLGRAQYRQGKAAARATLLGTATTFPAERAAADALFIVGDLDHDKGNLAGASELYRRAMEAHPSSEPAGESAMRLGALEFTAGRFAAAASIYDEYRTHHTNGRRYQQATYWAARAYQSAGQTDTAYARFTEAIASDPASYYGIRASDLRGDGGWHTLLAPSPVTGQQNATETEGALVRLDVLDQLGLERESAHELDRVKRHFAQHDGSFYALAEGFHDRGKTLAGILLGRDLRRREGAWNRRLLQIVFPFPYREEIIRYSERQGIDPYLVAGLIRQESMFNPTARSSAGAIGLMQIMPPTGKSLARQEGVGFQLSKLRDPAFNLRLGTRFVADLLGRYDGRLTYTLAAYNAGPTRVARWRNLPEATEDDLFAERIPFAETRDYVKIVQQNARIYRAVYAE